MTESPSLSSPPPESSPSPPVVKLQRLYLKNFLSFEYDKIELDPQFTMITGPNGAGKSSIYQALKFVLGSNNYDGRYQRWAEFIHKGSEMAQVQLEFELNGEEYAIQREVYTDRTIKFYIRPPFAPKYKLANANQVKDLIDKTKINPENIFTFMSQGSIDTIKNLKENELCSFVEKGVALYETREKIMAMRQKVVSLNGRFDALIAQKNNYSYHLREMEPKLKRLQQKRDYQKKLDHLNDELLWVQRDEILKEVKRIQEQLEALRLEIAMMNAQKYETEA